MRYWRTTGGFESFVFAAPDEATARRRVARFLRGAGPVNPQELALREISRKEYDVHLSLTRAGLLPHR